MMRRSPLAPTTHWRSRRRSPPWKPCRPSPHPSRTTPQFLTTCKSAPPPPPSPCSPTPSPSAMSRTPCSPKNKRLSGLKSSILMPYKIIPLFTLSNYYNYITLFMDSTKYPIKDSLYQHDANK